MTELDDLLDELNARHTQDARAAIAARGEYEERRGKVHQDDELWEPWSAAFVDWYVVERARDGDASGLPPVAITARELAAAGDPRADLARAIATSQRSLFEVRAVRRDGELELVDLLGGAAFVIDGSGAPAPGRATGQRGSIEGVEVGDVAELRLIGARGEVRLGRTFIYHPKQARDAIVVRARAMLAAGRSKRDVIDEIAQLRVRITRYRHMSAARVYEQGTRSFG